MKNSVVSLQTARLEKEGSNVVQLAEKRATAHVHAISLENGKGVTVCSIEP